MLLASEKRREFLIRFSILTAITVPLIILFLNMGAYTLAGIYAWFYLLVTYYLYHRHIRGVKPLSTLIAHEVRRTVQGPTQRLQEATAKVPGATGAKRVVQAGVKGIRGGCAKIASGAQSILRRRSKGRDESNTD
jgi:hypothetical protein